MIVTGLASSNRLARQEHKKQTRQEQYVNAGEGDRCKQR
jgi:hypothetical protein